MTDLLYYLTLFGAFIIGFLSEFIMKVASRHYEEYRDKVIRRRIMRGDLASKMRQFSDVWEDRECMFSPYFNLRKDLADRMGDIRESARDHEAGLSADVVSRIRKISLDFLNLVKKKPQETDENWSHHVKVDADKICEDLKQTANLVEK